MSQTQYSNSSDLYNGQQASYPPPPYAVPQAQAYAPVYPTAPVQKNGAAVAGLVLGIISMVAWLLPIAGIPLSIVGLVQSNRGMRLLPQRGMAIAGLVLCIIALALASINAIAGALLAIH